MLAAAA